MGSTRKMNRYFYVQPLERPCNSKAVLDIVARSGARCPHHGFQPHVFWLGLELLTKAKMRALVIEIRKSLKLRKDGYVQQLPSFRAMLGALGFFAKALKSISDDERRELLRQIVETGQEKQSSRPKKQARAKGS